MDKELERQAIRTFATVPEIYQQAFREVGADFPDELVGKIKKDPNQAVSILESDKNLKSAVINIYKQNKDAILQYIQQNSSMFREGGKFDYLKKFQTGGSIVDPTYRTVINAPGDTLRTKFYKYRTDEMQTYPNGNVRYTTRDNAGDNYSWSPDSNPSFIQRLWFGNQTASPETINNWNQLIENHKNDLVMDKTKQLQEGGRLKRKDMFNQASANRGFTKQQARLAYNNARRAGLSRDAATQAVIGQPTIEETTATIERPTLINEVSAPVGQAVASQETISARPTRNYDNVDFGSFNFGDAFNKARRYGLNEFTWNGNRYTTNFAIPALGPDGKNYSIADTLLQNGNISAPDWWISKQWEPATVLSGNGINPWPAIHAREINPPLKREGGKLSKENEANKKYIKASEKAGQEASKKMTDLKNKHKAELKKIK